MYREGIDNKMNKEQIDEILDAIIAIDVKKIIAVSGIKIEETMRQGNEKYKELLKKIMLKIEQGNYNYFFSKRLEEKHVNAVALLLCYSNKVLDMKKIIEDAKQLKIKDTILIDLMIATRDSEYIKQILEDKDKMRILGINKFYYIIKLIKATNDTEYMRSIVENMEKREELKLYKFAIKDLIILMNDKEYIKEIIIDERKRKQLDLDEYLIELTLAIGEPEYLDLLFEKIENSYNSSLYNQTINLPPNITIGIEIESEGIYSHLIEAVHKGWTLEKDASLNNGIEAKSPILTGDWEKSTQEIKIVCNRLKVLRTNFIRKMWRSYTYWLFLFNNG